MTGKPKILLFTDWYEPGFRAGGPIRSCVNFVAHMQENYRLDVFTSDRDLDSTEPYPGIEPDRWLPSASEDVRIYYMSPAQPAWNTIRKVLKEAEPDFLYLNSMFSLYYTIYPLLLYRLLGMKCRVVLSPRGMLRESALRFKPAKKKIFLGLFRSSGLAGRIFFHASDQTEKEDTQRTFGTATHVVRIANFPPALPEAPPVPVKISGELSMIFIGRIHPIKNLDYLLEVLNDISASIRLTIVGIIEEPLYWEHCQEIIRLLPDNIRVRHAGEIPHEEIPAQIAAHQILALPTRGENFGHAIFEALALGKPVLISDQTPWRNLPENHAGWDLPLQEPGRFRQAITEAAGFGQTEYDQWSGSARALALNFIKNSDIKKEYLELFR